MLFGFKDVPESKLQIRVKVTAAWGKDRRAQDMGSAKRREGGIPCCAAGLHPADTRLLRFLWLSLTFPGSPMKAPGGVEAEVGGFNFLEKTFKSVMEKKFTLPNKRCIGLEINDIFADVMGAKVQLNVIQVSELPSFSGTQANVGDELQLDIQLQKVSRQAVVPLGRTRNLMVDRSFNFQMDGQVETFPRSAPSPVNRHLYGRLTPPLPQEHLPSPRCHLLQSTSSWGLLDSSTVSLFWQPFRPSP